MSSIKLSTKKGYHIVSSVEESIHLLAEKVYQLYKKYMIISGYLNPSNSKVYQAFDKI